MLLLAVATSALAQQPDSTPLQAALDRLPAWPSTATAIPAPPTIAAPQWAAVDRLNVTITAATPGQAAYVAEHDSVDTHLRQCLAANQIPGARGEAPTAVPHRWAAFDSATNGRAALRLQIVAPISVCDAPDLLAAGALVMHPGAYVLAREDLESARVRSRGVPVLPVLVGRVPSTVVGAVPVARQRVIHQLRLYFAPDAFPPDERGRFATATVVVRNADSTTTSIPIDRAVFARAWRDLLPLRTARFTGASPARIALPALEAPHDSTLRAARSAYLTGELLRAAELASRRRDSTALSTGDQRFVALMAGSVWQAYGDTADARVEYATALDISPCLRLTAHPAFEQVLDAVRPRDVRCTTIPLQQQLAAAFVAPGGLQWLRGQHWLGAVAAGITGTLIVTALQREKQAHSTYNRYMGTAAAAPDYLLDEANSLQHQARTLAITAAGAWLASGVVGLVSEAAHAARIRPEQRYDVSGSTREAP